MTSPRGGGGLGERRKDILDIACSDSLEECLRPKFTFERSDFSQTKYWLSTKTKAFLKRSKESAVEGELVRLLREFELTRWGTHSAPQC